MAILNDAANAAFTKGISGSLPVLVSDFFTFITGILYLEIRADHCITTSQYIGRRVIAILRQDASASIICRKMARIIILIGISSMRRVGSSPHFSPGGVSY
jgi:hypothetical protein